MRKSSESPELKTALTLAGLSAEAAKSSAPEDRPDILSVLKFDVCGEEFALKVADTEGVVDCPRIAPLPAPPEGLIGVASVRGRMTLVMDLGLGKAPTTERRRLVLVKGDAQLGLVADRVEGVVALPPKSIRRRDFKKVYQDAATGQRSWPASLYFKEGKRLIPILDIEALAHV